MSNPTTALNVFFYFQKQELKLSFNSPNQAAAYQNRNRESRIFANEPSAVYLPLSASMVYIRDSSKGLVLGFSTQEDADRWCQTSILGRKHGQYEVHIGRGWTGEQLNQALEPDMLQPSRPARPQSMLFAMEPTPPSSSGSDSNMKLSPSMQPSPLSSNRSSGTFSLPSSLVSGAGKAAHRSVPSGHVVLPALPPAAPRYQAQGGTSSYQPMPLAMSDDSYGCSQTAVAYSLSAYSVPASEMSLPPVKGAQPGRRES